MKKFLLLTLLFSLTIHPVPIYSFHENLPTHTPAPVTTTPGVEVTPLPSEVLTQEGTPVSEDNTIGLPQTADLDQRTTILYIIGLVAVVGLILYLTRAK